MTKIEAKEILEKLKECNDADCGICGGSDFLCLDLARCVHHVTRGQIGDALIVAMERLESPTEMSGTSKKGFWRPLQMSEVTGYDPSLSGDDPLFGHFCSVCGSQAVIDDVGDEMLSRFCPDCGAEMRDET